MAKKSKKTPGRQAVKPGKNDFILNEKELEKVSGGVNPMCSEIGYGNAKCTKTGISSGCTEIGDANPDCTKVGF